MSIVSRLHTVWNNVAWFRLLLPLQFLLLLSLLVVVLPSAHAQTIADLSQPWVLAPNYNRNDLYCAMQAELNAPSVGYVVIQDGMIIAEGYSGNNKATDVNPIWSTTKSWTSMLIGRLVQLGKVQLNTTLGDIFTDETVWTGVTRANKKKTVTLRELLTMTAGLGDADDLETSMTMQVTLTGVLNASNYYGGRRGGFFYLGANHILSRVIHQVSGMTPLEFAIDQGIFDALGLNPSDYSWDQFGGVEGSASGLRMTVRAFAKLGQLYLQQGFAAENKPLLAPSWVAASTTNQLGREGALFDFNPFYLGYGYLWWTDVVDRENNLFHQFPEMEGSFSSLGFAGQIMSVFPDHNIVLATVTKDDIEIPGLVESALLVATASRHFGVIDQYNEAKCFVKERFGFIQSIGTLFYGVFYIIQNYLDGLWVRHFGS